MRRVPLLIGLALAGAQAGHLIAYAVRFGMAAEQMQSSGAHAYFPTAAKAMLGLAAIGLLMALLVMALARVLAGGGRRIATGPSFISLFAVLFTAQLGLFVAQEIVEAAIAGVPADSVSAVALWGMLGQLPAAALGAVTLRWLWSRVEQAVADLRSVGAVQRWAITPTAVPAQAWQPAYFVAGLDHSHGSRHARRGPPSFFIG